MNDGKTAPSVADGPTKTVSSSVAFVMNVRRLVGIEQFEFAPGLVLRRATDVEREALRVAIDKSHGPGHRHIWESPLPLGNATKRLPRDEWRYFVLTFRGSNASVYQFQLASNISPNEIETGLFFLWNEHHPLTDFGYSPDHFYQFLSRASRKDRDGLFLELSARDLELTKTVYQKLAVHDHDLLNLNHPLQQMESLKALRRGSSMSFLGYFAVIESLLTHPPKPTDPYDSITRQVKKKVALLDNRWPARLDYSSFGGTAPDKVWETMYAYRSQLAHGSRADFQGKLKILSSPEAAFRLLRDTVKAVIRQALEEPALVRDLREC